MFQPLDLSVFKSLQAIDVEMKASRSKCQHHKEKLPRAFKGLQTRRLLVLAKSYEKATFFTLRNNEIQGGGEHSNRRGEITNRGGDYT